MQKSDSFAYLPSLVARSGTRDLHLLWQKLQRITAFVFAIFDSRSGKAYNISSINPAKNIFPRSLGGGFFSSFVGAASWPRTEVPYQKYF